MNLKRPFVFSTDFAVSVILCLYAVSLYFSDRIVIAATVLLVAGGAAMIVSRTVAGGGRLPPPHPLVYGWLAVYLVRVVWLLVSNDPLYGLRWLDTGLPFILFPLLFQYLPVSERAFRTTLAFFVRFAFLFCAITLVSVAWHCLAVPVDVGEWLRSPKACYPLAYAWTNEDHPSFLCIVYLLALPAAFFLKRRYGAVSTLEIGALVVVEAAVLAFTGARVGLIILPALLLLMALYGASCRRKLIIAGSLAALTVALTAGLWGRAQPLVDRFKDPIRMQLWETAVASIKERPLLGVGTGGMREAIRSPEMAERLHYPQPQPLSYPHNQYLGEAMHFGFLGAIPLFGTLVCLLLLALRRKNLLLQAVLLTAFIFMCTEMPFDSHRGVNFFLFFLSLFFAQRQTGSAGRKTTAV